MRVPLGWLAEWIDLPASRDELMERLTLGGLEIEDVIRTGPDLTGVVVGDVVERGSHPNADRLSLCRVDPGEGEPVDVVCGAPNVAAGQKIAFASAGTRLPDGSTLKRSKIRGVVSNGMICSTRELGLGDDHEGILVLDPAAVPGTPLAEVLPGSEPVLELEITPNRGDWASLLGIAREVRAHFGGALRLPPLEPEEAGAPAADAVTVRVEDAEGCPHYVARIVRGVRVAPSPDWLAEKLEAAGQRPINNIVDVTNLVLLELGQPLHAFDLATLRGAEIRVRSAAPGEKLVTLDGQTRELQADDLVIADAERPVAVAGVMGGAETEVSEGTRDVLLESAHFHPTRVRRTARRLGLHSEASYRFERGIDPEGVARAADRAALLLAELAGGGVAPGRVEARGDALPHTDEVRLDPGRVNRLLGTDLAPDSVAELLERADFATRRDGAELMARPPSYRHDVAGPHDLVEEVGRIHGYDRIPTTLPVVELAPVERPLRQRLLERARTSLADQGLMECITFPFESPDDWERLGLAANDPRRRGVRLRNPLVEDEALLRTSLVPSLVRTAQQNLDRQVDRVRLFEVGSVFLAGGGEEGLPAEPLYLAGIVTRGDRPGLWEPRDRIPLFFLTKGVAERVLFDLGYAAWCRPADEGSAEPYQHPGAANRIGVGDQVIGSVGELHPEAARRFGVEAACAVFELDLSALVALPRREPAFREVSRQPSARRDLAVLVDRERSAGEILDAIAKTGGDALAGVELFDRYEGAGVPEGRVSLAFRLVFQRGDRAFKDEEVAKLTDRVVKMLAHRFGGQLR
jgi:phenylalanyl-tRNA synthetase beta chain